MLTRSVLLFHRKAFVVTYLFFRQKFPGTLVLVQKFTLASGGGARPQNAPLPRGSETGWATSLNSLFDSHDVQY